MIDDLEGGVGIYVAESKGGRTLYVGSVYRHRHASGIRTRLREHFRRPARRDTWQTITTFPMSGLTTEREVLRIEGNVAIWLVPSEGHAWPRVRRG